MMKSRDQALFDSVYAIIAPRYKVYDYKPMKEVGYPFVELESTQTLHETTKSHIRGSVVLILSVWGLQRNRKQVSEMAEWIMENTKQFTAQGYSWHLDFSSSDVNIMDDTTTNTPLKRARLMLHYTHK